MQVVCACGSANGCKELSDIFASGRVIGYDSSPEGVEVEESNCRESVRADDHHLIQTKSYFVETNGFILRAKKHFTRTCIIIEEVLRGSTWLLLLPIVH